MKKVLLVIFDGFGEAPDGPGNAITQANAPHLKTLRAHHPFGLLQAAGEAVGVTEGTMGGSEIGHFTMGAGRVVPQFLLAINKDIESGEFAKKKPIADALEYAKKTGKKLHLFGMISDKGVHSHIQHLFALLQAAKKAGLTQVYIHAIADGRDVEERSVKKYLQMLQAKIDELGVGKIATLIGRYYSMDRDTNWERTEQGYKLMTQGEGENFEDPLEAVDHFYSQNPELTDQYMTPFVFDQNGLIQSGDTLIYFNYRTDRTRQLTSAFVDPDFSHFKKTVSDLHFVCMGPYSENAPVVYLTPVVTNNLSDWLSAHQIHQLRVAETEKYAHVTYFFNSQVEEPKPLEDRILIDTPKIKTHDEKPELSSAAITKTVVSAMEKGDHQVIIANYAQIDLVAHTGIYAATLKAVEAADKAIGELYESAMKNGYTLLLTGDHGNAEEMLFADGTPRPSHTTNPVILLVADPDKKITHVKNGGLADIAPTMLKILELEKPSEMTGQSLI